MRYGLLGNSFYCYYYCFYPVLSTASSILICIIELLAGFVKPDDDMVGLLPLFNLLVSNPSSDSSRRSAFAGEEVAATSMLSSIEDLSSPQESVNAVGCFKKLLCVLMSSSRIVYMRFYFREPLCGGSFS